MGSMASTCSAKIYFSLTWLNLDGMRQYQIINVFSRQIVASRRDSGDSSFMWFRRTNRPSLNPWNSRPHSITIFLCPPTIVHPNARNASLSLARIIVQAGSIGLCGSTCEASFAACSIASISSLQSCISRGHTTIGCRNTMSLAADSCA